MTLAAVFKRIKMSLEGGEKESHERERQDWR